MLVTWTVSWLGSPFQRPEKLSISLNTFFTLYLTVFTGLVLATKGPNRMNGLAVGWPVPLGMNLTFAVCQVLFFQLDFRQLFQVINILGCRSGSGNSPAAFQDHEVVTLGGSPKMSGIIISLLTGSAWICSEGVIKL